MHRLRFPSFIAPYLTALFLAVILGTLMIQPNQTHSMPYGLYLRLPAIGELHEGDLVQVESPMRKGYVGSHGTTNLLKRIEKITDTGLYYVRGESEDSYDSRYFGFIGRDYIKARIVPLIITSRPIGALE